MTKTEVKNEFVNPFSPKSKWSLYESIKFYVIGPIIVPIKVLLMLILLGALNILCRIALLGYNPKLVDGHNPPLAWWRKLFINIAFPIFRVVLMVMGFWCIKVKGKVASRDVAPICVANHGTAFDGFILDWFLMSAPIMRAESAANPLLGPLFNAVEAVFVERKNKDSRSKVVSEIIHRSTHPGYPRLLIFPEGTTTNGDALITFKSGAFYPGVPIQPILLKFPNNHWNPATPGNSELKIMYRALTQFVIHAEVEYLEPYFPNEEERKNPALYAKNVQKVMASALNIPITKHGFQDSLFLTQAAKKYKQFDMNFTVVEMIEKYGLSFEKNKNDFDDLLKIFQKIDINRDSKIDFYEFEEAFKLLAKKTDASKAKLQNPEYLKLVFNLMDMDENGTIDFREFILGMRMLNRNSYSNDPNDISHIKFAFTIFDLNGDMKISKQEFSGIMSLVYEDLDAKSLDEKVDELFGAIDTNKKGEITFELFKNAVEKDPSLIDFASKALDGFVHQLETPTISKKSPFE
eukprot:gene5307-8925_t